MGLASSARLLAAGVVWRRTGARTAGASLARALNGDEQEQTLAGMGLVRAGVRSVGALEAEKSAHGPSRMMVRVLADIGGPQARTVLEEIAQGPGTTAELARDVLDRGETP